MTFGRMFDLINETINEKKPSATDILMENTRKLIRNEARDEQNFLIEIEALKKDKFLDENEIFEGNWFKKRRTFNKDIRIVKVSYNESCGIFKYTC